MLFDKHNPDIVLLNETHLKEKHTLYLKNYNVVRHDRPGGKAGGTAILVKKNFKYEVLDNTMEAELLENTAISLETTNNNMLILVASYARKGPTQKFRSDLEKLFDKLNLISQSNYYIVAGDFNAKHVKWANRINDERGINLLDWLENNDIKYRLQLHHSNTPSFPKNASYIDLLLSDARLEFLNSINNKLPVIQIESDYTAIIAQIEIQRQNIITTNETIGTYNYPKAKWSKFQQILQSYNPNIPSDANLSIVQTEEQIHNIQQKIIEVMDQTIPKIKPQNATDKYTSKKIKQLIQNESQLISAARKLHRSKNAGPHVNHIIKLIDNKIKAIRKKIHTEVNKRVNSYWLNRIGKISTKQPNKMFNEINKIFRRKETIELPALKVPANKENLIHRANIDLNTLTKVNKNNIIINDKKSKLNFLGIQYASVSEQNTNLNDPKFRKIIDRKYNEIMAKIADNIPSTITTFSRTNTALFPNQIDSYQDYFTNSFAITRKLKSLNNKKSSGNDKIPNFVLKKLPHNIINNLTILFNNLLNHAHFPTFWKKAKVIPIHKKGRDKTNPNSYRPISLLPNLGKVFERIINDKIMAVCQTKSLIPENQYGFRRSHTTTHAINKLSSDINWALNDGMCTGACLIDLEKAFDTVWLNGLITKLYKKEFSLPLIKLIHSMIFGRSFVTSFGNVESSQTFYLTDGLQQGTINSPVLFNIYTSDILQLFGPTNTNCQLLAFADDLIAYTSSSSPKHAQSTLQNCINKIFSYYKAWKLKVNADKCETILFRPTYRKASSAIRTNHKNFSLKSVGEDNNTDTLTHKNIVKYLGLQLDNRLLYNKHIETQLKKAKAVFIANARLFYSKRVDKKVKLTCYQLLVRPIITYGCEIWYNVGASVMEEIRVFERRCLRACMNLYRTPNSNYQKYYSNSTLYNAAGINRIDNFMLKLIRNYFACVSQITINSLIFPIAYPDENYIKKTLTSGYIPPEAFIYLDKHGYTQNNQAVPILYHVPRHRANKSITYSPLSSEILLKYSTAVSEKDKLELNEMDKKKIWWLENSTT